MGGARHWERVYTEKPADAVSWYAPHLVRSLELIEAAAPTPDAPILDVGGGASTLVDDLLARGHGNVTVLDLSARALELARARVGDRARWIVGDVRTAGLPSCTVWHDRAVFHFLTEAADRAVYVAQVERALAPGGHVVIATFGPRGPEKCSGLPVVRWDAEALTAEFGKGFERLRAIEETHVTPWGSEQAFVYCLLRRRRRVTRS